MVLPDDTVTVAGTVAAAVLSLDRATTIPAVGADVSRCMVPVEFIEPPATLVGFSVTDEIPEGVTVRVPFNEPFNVAVMVTVVEAATLLVVAVNVAEVAPVATTMLAGIVTDDDVSDKVTVRCAVVPAAGPFRVTVPVEFATPPSTLAGLMLTERTAAGRTVNVADCAAVAPT